MNRYVNIIYIINPNRRSNKLNSLIPHIYPLNISIVFDLLLGKIVAGAYWLHDGLAVNLEIDQGSLEGLGYFVGLLNVLDYVRLFAVF